jgi:hypothetical protein
MTTCRRFRGTCPACMEGIPTVLLRHIPVTVAIIHCLTACLLRNLHRFTRVQGDTVNDRGLLIKPDIANILLQAQPDVHKRRPLA